MFATIATKVFAVFLVLHGFAHGVGFAVPWKLVTPKDQPYTTTVLWANVDLGDAGIRLFALLWLPAIVAFAVAAYGIWQGRSWATPALAATAAGSLIVCIVAMPAAVVGTFINVAILAGVAVAAFVARTRRSAVAVGADASHS
jgi:hypothetical protein